MVYFIPVHFITFYNNFFFNLILSFLPLAIVCVILEIVNSLYLKISHM